MTKTLSELKVKSEKLKQRQDTRSVYVNDDDNENKAAKLRFKV